MPGEPRDTRSRSAHRTEAPPGRQSIGGEPVIPTPTELLGLPMGLGRLHQLGCGHHTRLSLHRNPEQGPCDGAQDDLCESERCRLIHDSLRLLGSGDRIARARAFRLAAGQAEDRLRPAIARPGCDEGCRRPRCRRPRCEACAEEARHDGRGGRLRGQKRDVWSRAHRGPLATRPGS